MADEYVDVLDGTGERTDRIVLKSVAHRQGIPHLSVHVWIYRREGEVLLQRRSHDKDVYPGLWDVSMGGHVGAGEGIIQSALREIEEELGKKLSARDLHHAFVHHADEDLGELKVHEFIHVFLCRCDDPLSSYVLQESEVDELRFFPLDGFPYDIVPRPAYHRKVREALRATSAERSHSGSLR